MKNNIINFIGCDSKYKDSNVVLFGAGFDGTTSNRPGTRFAPQAIRNESYGLETYSPYFNRDLSEINVFDNGDIEFPLGNAKKVLKIIENKVSKIVSDGKIPLMIGGEHLVTLGSLRGLKKHHNDIVHIHIDAHTDLRDDYLGETLSHATYLKCAINEKLINEVYMFGIRSGEQEEWMYARDNLYIEPFSIETIGDVIPTIKDKNVYITIDLDCLDPSIFPGTGTPEPGGISYKELLEAIIEISKCNKIIGCDINELAPNYDLSGVSTAVAAKTVREMLFAITIGEKND